MKIPFPGACALLVTLALTLAGCDNPAGGSSAATNSRVTPRTLPAGFSERKAICYSGYRDTNGGTLTQAQIDTDIDLMHSKGFNLIRVFGSNSFMVRTLLADIRSKGYDMKVQLGIWIDGSKAKADAANQTEIAEGIRLANLYKDIVATVSVGNEKMVSWNTWAPCPAKDMISYIQQVRGQVSQPVTTDDNWAVFANSGGSYPTTDQLLATLDYVAVHTYPLLDTPYNLWDWQQEKVSAGLRAAAMMDAAIAAAKADYTAVRSYMDGKGFASTPALIGETGWKTSASDGEFRRAHPVNQKMYYDRLAAWAAEKSASGPKAIFYFEAFDEPWKAKDDMWGLWDVDRKEKYVLSGTGYQASDAVYYLPPATITKNNYLIYADTVAADATTEVPSADALKWAAWDGNTGTWAETTAFAGEGTKSELLTPVPSAGGWGWGLILMNTVPDDLSNFQASGHLRFKLKTDYPGTLEAGFYTTGTGGSVDAYVNLPVGSYGRTSAGGWDDISIPIADLVKAAKPAYNQPATASINLKQVATPFVIADRYVNTKTSGSPTNKIYVDQIRWTRD